MRLRVPKLLAHNKAVPNTFHGLFVNRRTAATLVPHPGLCVTATTPPQSLWSVAMSSDPRHKLLFGPYRPPSLRVSDVSTCLVRNCDVIVSSWTDARISWPRCRSVERPAGGSGLLVNEELARAVMTESEAAIRHWWGASVSTVRWWRRTLGVTRTNNPGHSPADCRLGDGRGLTRNDAGR